MPDSLESLKPKVAVFLPTPNEVQRFGLGGAFDGLRTQFDLSFVLCEADRGKMAGLLLGHLPGADVHFVDIPAERMKSWSKLFKAACHQFAAQSRSFALRIDVAYAGEEGRKKLEADRAAVLGLPAARSRGAILHRLPMPQRVRDKLLAVRAEAVAPKDLDGKKMLFDPAVYEDFRRATLKRLGQNGEMAAVLAALQPAAVIIPTSLLDPQCNDLLWLCEEKDLTVLAIQSGWDNLSSKGIVQHQPALMGVWGPQSGEHARDIQRVKAGHVLELGSPHYEALYPRSEAERLAMRERLGVRADQRLLMFGGSFRQFDETSTLRVLDSLIETEGLDMKVVYRPHPYRLDRLDEDNFFEMEWKHVVFDEEMKDRYLMSKQEPGYIKRERPIYSMDYLATVLTAADAVISPMSTLILEAMIMQRPTMAVAFADDKAVYGASTASQMTHFDIIRNQDAALIWCDREQAFAGDVKRLMERVGSQSMIAAQTDLLERIVRRAPGTYAERLNREMCDTVMPAVLKKEREKFAPPKTISHIYAADRLMQEYAGVKATDQPIPGYYQHGWVPPHYNAYPEFVALHKKYGRSPLRHGLAGRDEKSDAPQWVARQDQAETLRRHGYGKVEAIGLPFAYLPEVDVERRPNSVLVMPPNARKRHFAGDPLAEAYADYAQSLRESFEHVYACVSERDYLSGEWRTSFQRRGIPVIIGGNKFDRNALQRMKTILSAFDCVTTNAFGSHIAYAAHCGARVCIDGPYCEWDPERSSQALRSHPNLAGALVELQSRQKLLEEFPFLFRAPREAEALASWGDEQIGLANRRSPGEIRTLFGWVAA